MKRRSFLLHAGALAGSVAGIDLEHILGEQRMGRAPLGPARIAERQLERAADDFDRRK